MNSQIKDSPLVGENSSGRINKEISDTYVHTPEKVYQIDIQTLMDDFDLALTTIDEIIELAPAGLKTKVEDSIDLGELKQSLHDDLYRSIERLQKEISQTSLTRANIDGKAAISGHITVPALCGVLASFIEAAPGGTVGKRAFLMEALLESLSFLDDIPEAARAALNMKSVLRVAFQAQQEGNDARSLRSLASQLILRSKGDTNDLVLVDLATQRWTAELSKINWAKVDFSPQQLHRVAASEFTDPLMEAMRHHLGIKTVLEEAGIKEGKARIKANVYDEALSHEDINTILRETESEFVDSTSPQTMKTNAAKAIEATLWTSLYTWYRDMAEAPSSSIKGLQLIGDGSGDLRLLVHTFLDADVMEQVKEGKRYAMYQLQQNIHGFSYDILLLGSAEVNKGKPVIDWRNLWSRELYKRFDPKWKGLGYRAERYFAFTRAYSEFGYVRTPGKLERLFRGTSDKWLSAYWQELKGVQKVLPTDDAMRQILEGFGFQKAKLNPERNSGAVYRVTETQVIEDAAKDGRIFFRIDGQDFRENLSVVQKDVNQTKNKAGKTWVSIFYGHIKSVVAKKARDNSSTFADEILDSMKYWYRRMGLDHTPMGNEDYYLFFADVAMRKGLSKNVEPNSAAENMAHIFDDPDWIELDHLSISNMLPGSMEALLDHVQIYYNIKANRMTLVAIQDKIGIVGHNKATFKDPAAVAKDLHTLKGFIEGLFNEIKSRRTGNMWGGKEGVFYNLHNDDPKRMQKIIDYVQKSDGNIEIYGVQRMARVTIEDMDTAPKYTFDVSISVIQPDGFGTYGVIQRLKSSPAGNDFRKFGEKVEEILDLMKHIAPEKAKFFEARMLWGVNAEQLSHAEIEEIYAITQKNIYELSKERGIRSWNSRVYTDEILDAVGGDYEKLGRLYGILDLLDEYRFKLIQHQFVSLCEK